MAENRKTEKWNKTINTNANANTKKQTGTQRRRRKLWKA